MSAVPVFAVVGRVNKGKSSVLATLAEDDSVRIGRRPGTTVDCREYPIRIDGEVVLKIIDTPGFEEADRALEWLRSRETSAASRPELVAAFVSEHAEGEDFIEERKLLRPILEGACVLYVVDGTQPYRTNYQAEMEILRWTGQPGMALINRIGEGDHGAEWRRALDQYFKIVRDFDAHAVSFTERVRLLRTFRELSDAQRAPLDRAINALIGERARRRAEAAATLTDLLLEALTLSLDVTVRQRSELDSERAELERRFHDGQRAAEQRARQAVEASYAHHRGEWSGAEVARPVFDQDLFAEEAWRLLGLSPKQLVAAGAVGGAVVGGSIDAAVGGASFMTGTLIGTVVGGGVALYSAMQRFAKARPVGSGRLGGIFSDLTRYWSGTLRFRIGPHQGANFPWVVLDRALLHYRAVIGRTHAVRGVVELEDAGAGERIVSSLDRPRRDALERLFTRIRKKHQDVPAALRDELYQQLRVLLQELDPEPD